MSAQWTDVSVGDTLIADSGFTCLSDGDEKIVQFSKEGLFIDCRHFGGKHYLDGQLNEKGELVGLTKKVKT